MLYKVKTRIQTRLPYTLYLMCTVHVHVARQTLVFIVCKANCIWFLQRECRKFWVNFTDTLVLHNYFYCELNVLAQLLETNKIV